MCGLVDALMVVVLHYYFGCVYIHTGCIIVLRAGYLVLCRVYRRYGGDVLVVYYSVSM